MKRVQESRQSDEKLRGLVASIYLYMYMALGTRSMVCVLTQLLLEPSIISNTTEGGILRCAAKWPLSQETSVLGPELRQGEGVLLGHTNSIPRRYI